MTSPAPVSYDAFWEAPEDTRGVAAEFMQEDALEDLYRNHNAWATYRGERGDVLTVVSTPEAVAVIRKGSFQGSGIVMFRYYYRDYGTVRSFWYNPHSVASLGEALRSKPEMRVGVREIFTA